MSDLSGDANGSKLALRFISLVKEKRAADLDPWLKEATRSRIVEMVGFAQGLDQDREAVVAALSTAFSNGQTEGQVNRLKVKKRQM